MRTVADKSLEQASVTRTASNSNAVRSRADTTEPSTPPDTTKNNEIKAINVGKRPLQGTKELVRIAINRSRLESMIRHPTTPAALHPSPIHRKREMAVCGRSFFKKRELLTGQISFLILFFDIFLLATIKNVSLSTIASCVFFTTIHCDLATG